MQSVDLFDWSRGAVRLEVNANVIRVTPVSIRTDRTLLMNSYFPVLSDWSRLLLSDLQELQLVTTYIKPTLFEKETTYISPRMLFDLLRASLISFESTFTPTLSFTTMYTLFDSINSTNTMLSSSILHINSNKESMVQTIEPASPLATWSINYLMQPNKYIGMSTFNYFRPLNNWFKSSDIYLHLTRINKWATIELPNPFSSIVSEIDNELSFFNKMSIAVNNINSSMFLEYQVKLENPSVYSEEFLYPYTYNSFLNRNMSFLYFKKAYMYYNMGLLITHLITSVKLPFFSALHHSRISIWFIRNTKTNFSLFLTKKQQLLLSR